MVAFEQGFDAFRLGEVAYFGDDGGSFPTVGDGEEGVVVIVAVVGGDKEGLRGFVLRY